jgi:LacI family transcriptional regulator
MIARMRDVAERANVSVATVSIFLNTPDQVGARSAERIRAAIAELGFVRNAAASQLRRGTSKTIAFIAFDVGDPFSYSVARGARRRAAEAGFRLVLADTDGDGDVEREYLSLFEEQRVRGILLQSVLNQEGAPHGRSTVRVPLVMIDHRTPLDEFSSVSVNNLLGGELAAQHLIDQGKSRLAFVGGPVSIQQIADRLHGVELVVERTPGTQLEFFDTAERDAAAGRTVAEEIISRPRARRPDAVFCVNDTIAIGMLQRFAVDPTTRVPEDIGVVGYNDVAMDRYPSLPLTSVRQPHEMFGATAVDLLLSEVEGVRSTAHRQVVFDPELVVRETTVGGAGLFP